MIAKLEAALKQVDRGEGSVAVNQLEACAHQINAMLRAGILLPEDGQPLLGAVNEVIVSLNQ